MISYKNFFTSNFALFLQHSCLLPSAFPLLKSNYSTGHDISGGLRSMERFQHTANLLTKK
ncbi:MAG: hypothetical protein F6K39_07590 [Okeania sp. SIO3B3]|nr:hypothetical protein [Okeania sp. SIO3B3]